MECNYEIKEVWSRHTTKDGKPKFPLYLSLYGFDDINPDKAWLALVDINGTVVEGGILMEIVKDSEGALSFIRLTNVSDHLPVVLDTRDTIYIYDEGDIGVKYRQLDGSIGNIKGYTQK